MTHRTLKQAYLELRAYQKAHRSEFSDALGLRVHRAISWLKRSVDEETDLDACFIFLWIAFNAAYACEFPTSQRPQERQLFSQFIRKLCDLDDDNTLANLLWERFSGAIRMLVENHYVFEPFWQYQRGEISEEAWQKKFQQSKHYALKSIGQQNTGAVYEVVMDRLYTLRNQIMHGGATWNSSLNRHQIKDAVAIMKQLVPIIIDIMMRHPDAHWGNGNYPPIKED